MYTHINKINGKQYIGITCQTEDQRFRNGQGYKRSKYFYKAIQKYGWDAFEHIVLYRELSEEEAKAKEIELIAKYDTRNPDKGYNVTPGGEGYSGEDNPMFGKHHSDEAKRLLKTITEAEQRSLVYEKEKKIPENMGEVYKKNARKGRKYNVF